MSDTNQMLHESKSLCRCCLIRFTGGNVVILQLDIIWEKSTHEEVFQPNLSWYLTSEWYFLGRKEFVIACIVESPLSRRQSSTIVTISRSVSFECIYFTIFLTVVWKSSVLPSSWHRTIWLVVSGETPHFGHTFLYSVESIVGKCALIPRAPVTCFVMKTRKILGDLCLVNPFIPFQ